MKQLILALGVLLSGQLLAQNTFPTNGNVGVGTTNPTSGLDVNRHMKVDSTLMVKDSVRIKSRLTVDEKVVFKDNLVVKGSLLRAQNNARINNNLFVDNKLTVDGIARMNGIVKMMGLTEATQQVIDNGGYSLLVTKQNGEVIEVPPTILAELFGATYPDPPVDDSNPCSNYNSSILQAAGWAFNENVSEIFTGCSVNKVGIGTYHPSYNLDVKGTARMTKNISGNLQVGYAYYQNTTPNALISGYEIGSSDIINLGTIGSNNQSVTNFSVNNDGTTILKAKPNKMPLSVLHANGNLMAGFARTGALIINCHGNEAMIIKNTSNNKIFQINNNGMVRAREIKVDEDNWPDYVFDENFTILSLEDVAKYIEQHKHLPGVPSAEEIKTEGLSLGKMQKILMQKIEELTLYTLEQNNQIQNLETKVNTLETENQQLKSELQHINDRLDQLEAKLNH